ncbi:hypothetical protein BH10PSE13_BH10PSE13_23110 [soil metagenome]
MTGVWKDSRPACQPVLPLAAPEALHVLLLRRDGTRIATVRRTGDRHGITLPLWSLARIVAQTGAASLVMVHNHPSGDPRPSRADMDATHAVWRMARMLGATLRDHLIIGRDGTFSFRAQGML